MPQKHMNNRSCYWPRGKVRSVSHNDMFFFSVLSLPPATKLREGYVFTCVCDSVRGGGGISVPACTTGHMTRGVSVWGVSVWGFLVSVQGVSVSGVSLSGGSLSGGSLSEGFSVQRGVCHC